MSKRIRHPFAYQQACSRKERRYAHALDTVQARIVRYLETEMHKIMSAPSRNVLIWMIAKESMVTARMHLHGLQQHRSREVTAFMIVQDALNELISSGTLELYEDEYGVVLGCENTWPPESLRPFTMTVEDIDPGFNWHSLTNVKCPFSVLSELATH